MAVVVLTGCGGGADDSPTAAPAGASTDAAALAARGEGRVGSADRSTVAAITGITGTTYHVRVDGGTAAQCNGTADAPYPGTGSNLACAWSSPMVALPNAGPARIAGGDTLLIHKGQFMIGIGAPGAVGCSTNWPWDCVMQPVPSGPDAARPTRILGEGYNTVDLRANTRASTCRADRPQLWGTQRVNYVLNLKGSNNVQVACLELTDHSPCVQFHASPALRCNRDAYPFGEWAARGIYAADSGNVQLTDLNIHGLSNTGIAAGRISDWTLLRVRIAANGWVGFDGDLGEAAGSSNSGAIRLLRTTVEWNGCAETYPEGQPTGCWGQSAGGYGDGLGTARTGGHWLIEDSSFLHNVSDGLDLLYADGSGSITVNRVWAEGNAGNQLKVSGPASLTNSVAIANCSYFKGRSFTWGVDDCRALGDAIAVNLPQANSAASIVNTTVISEGNVTVLFDGAAGGVLTMSNNVLVGLPMYFDITRTSADVYMNRPGLSVVESHDTKQTVRNAVCNGVGVVCGNAGLPDWTLADFHNTLSFSAPAVELLASSPARNSGLAAGGLVPTVDFYRRPRPVGGGVDRGALEMQQ